MDPQIRKRKKQEAYKVTINHNELNSNVYQIKEVPCAYFPCQPYPQQITLITKIHQAIQNRNNALIESPTGTGKTLCMLVGALSSLASITKMSQSTGIKVPKIYYLTRTHSQITQIISQLSRLPFYTLKSTTIASRQHLCINSNLSQLKGKLLDRGCQQQCKQKLCRYKQQTENIGIIKQWLNIQQLCQRGKKKGFCPYFYSKVACQKCQLVIMPFNYVLDWGLMESNCLGLRNAVVLFDQAHNVDSLAQEGSSMEIDTQNLTQCLIQLKNLQQSSKCRYLHKKFQTENNDVSELTYLNKVKIMISRMIVIMKQYNIEQKNFTHFEDMLKIIKKMTNFVYNSEQFCGLDLNNYEDKIGDFERVKKLFGQKKIQSSQYDSFCSVISKIMKTLDQNSSNIQDYYMSIGPKSSKTISIKLNCLNASFTFQRISQQKPRSIILCSGTLGSFQIWQKQLGIDFKTVVKIPSFITNKQVSVSILQSSLTKSIKYQFSYQNKHNDQQYIALSQDLKQIQQIVPNGIVVAFSTYQLMQKSIIYCTAFKKTLFFQSKNQNVQRVYQKYRQAALSEKGAILFIVIKGKFSQGINFNDQLCRCLIVVGIPFLPPNDFKVVKKKSYLHNKFGKQIAQQWYYAQTFKAVNQVIGRAIRSKNDYSCILLVDQRYTRKDIIKQLPSWFTNALLEGCFAKCTDKIRKFFINKIQKQQQNLHKNVDNSFDMALSKTILATNQNQIDLQTLLNQQTPIKPQKLANKKQKNNKRPHKTLKLDSQQEIVIPRKTLKLEEEDAVQTNCIEEIPEMISNTKKQEKIANKRNTYPWMSLQFFIGDQIKDYLSTSKAKKQQQPKQHILQQNPLTNEHQPETESTTVTYFTSNRKKKQYI